MSKKPDKAINVFDEAVNVYYDHLGDCSEIAKQQISLHALSEIWEHMVVPAITRVRQLDREGRQNQ